MPSGQFPAIVLYDDRCGYCTANAEKGRRYQRPGALEWLGNSTPRAQAMLKERGLLGKELETLIVLSTATGTSWSPTPSWRAAQGLRWPWRMYAGIRFLPKPMRDKVYRKVAEDRDRHGCHLPPIQPSEPDSAE